MLWLQLVSQGWTRLHCRNRYGEPGVQRKATCWGLQYHNVRTTELHQACKRREGYTGSSKSRCVTPTRPSFWPCSVPWRRKADPGWNAAVGCWHFGPHLQAWADPGSTVWNSPILFQMYVTTFQLLLGFVTFLGHPRIRHLRGRSQEQQNILLSRDKEELHEPFPLPAPVLYQAVHKAGATEAALVGKRKIA